MRKKLTRKGYKHVTRIGRHRVEDATAFVRHDAEGNVILSHQELIGYERRAARVLLQEAKSVDGSVLKFARKALELRQADLALLLDYTPERICHLERGEGPIPRAVQFAVANLLCRVEELGDDALNHLMDAERDDPSLIEVPTVKRKAV